MKTVTLFIFAIVVYVCVTYVFNNTVGVGVGLTYNRLFDGDLNNNRYECPTKSKAHKMCMDLASSVCRAPTYPDNECWMSQYQICKNRGGSSCECTKVANDRCDQGGMDVADNCVTSVFQKCLAGQGMAIDPDRGAPMITHTY